MLKVGGGATYIHTYTHTYIHLAGQTLYIIRLVLFCYFRIWGLTFSLFHLFHFCIFLYFSLLLTPFAVFGAPAGSPLPGSPPALQRCHLIASGTINYCYLLITIINNARCIHYHWIIINDD